MKGRPSPSAAVWSLLVCLALATFPVVRAGQVDLAIPLGSRTFGTNVTLLPNGNFVVTDPLAGPLFAVAGGAVRLYDGVTLALISTLTGSLDNDRVGSGGITVLSNGNYVVSSPNWGFNGGAVTWCSATTGMTGFVSSANSLVGSGPSAVTALNNGNYVVRNPTRNNGAATNAGAVTWANGTTGVSGIISATNSLIGGSTNDQVGGGITVLTNGNFVVSSIFWNGARGAATWGSGMTGVTGILSSANSLVGSTTNDQVGSAGVTALNNGNYVVNSTNWDNGAVANVGAATWGNGTTGVTGVVSSANSLVGGTANDRVGSSGVTALNNGNYVVSSPNWDNGATTVPNVGAASWANGTSGLTGVVSTANSLVGSTANDLVGGGGVTALNNGNYVVGSSSWHNGAVAGAGAATWGNGMSSVTGTVSSANSLVGSTANSLVGGGGVTALSNGNYVVRSPNWNGGGLTNAGAATWGNGATGVTGVVSLVNSLIGSTTNSLVGGGGATALNNGNYVVRSPNWNNGTSANVGAVTWGNGTSGVTGAVSVANSLVGSLFDDQVGNPGVTALNNGNYVVSSANWYSFPNNSGAVTWGNGMTGVTGLVSTANSLIGVPTAFSDNVGSGGVTALNNGNYVVSSPSWEGSGAATWGNGMTGVTAVISSDNSLVGAGGDAIGFGGITALNDGNYVVLSTNWNGSRGAVSLGNGTLGATGFVGTANSVLGTVTNGGRSMVFAYNVLNAHIIVGYPATNRVSVSGITPKLVVQQPLNMNLTNDSAKVFGAPPGGLFSVVFTIRNIDFGDLTGLGITIDGAGATSFAVITNPVSPVTFSNSTTFTVQFAPTNSGPKTAALHIASNDPQQNPFNINLTGQVLSFTQDTDGDGLVDAEEFYLAPLGFDWQVSQPVLVSTFFANANASGLFTTNQIQALNVGTPLLIRDPLTGLFTLTIGVQKSTNLVQFFPFPMTAPQTTINGQGNLEFLFTVPDNAAFFRLESK